MGRSVHLPGQSRGRDLHRYLRCQKKRKKRYGSYQRRGGLANQVSIDKRPAIVDRKTRIGDWEVDTVIGKGHQQALVTLNERKSMYPLIDMSNDARQAPSSKPLCDCWVR